MNNSRIQKSFLIVIDDKSPRQFFCSFIDKHWFSRAFEANSFERKMKLRLLFGMRPKTSKKGFSSQILVLIAMNYTELTSALNSLTFTSVINFRILSIVFLVGLFSQFLAIFHFNLRSPFNDIRSSGIWSVSN